MFNKNQQNDNEIIKFFGISTLIGASLGDSMGSFCEFLEPNENNQTLIWTDYTSQFKSLRGQVTDDSEMSISMSLGILDSIIKKIKTFNDAKLNCNPISFHYLKWINSRPFDVGNTTYNALKIKDSAKYFDNDFFNNDIAEQFYQNSKNYNKNSLSNGFLMRHTPMTVYLYYLFELNKTDDKFNFKKYIEEEKFYELFNLITYIIGDEIRLTHYNPEAVAAAALYDFIILTILILRDQKPDKFDSDFKNVNNQKYLDLTRKFIESLLNSLCENDKIYIEFFQKIENTFKKIINYKSFEYGKNDILINSIGIENIGYYLHAINLIFFILKFFSEFSDIKNYGIYRSIINFICNLGGDTDTNCCIVGGVIGALIGVDNLGKDYLDPHLNFVPIDSEGKARRSFVYSPAILAFYSIKLFGLMNKETGSNKKTGDSEDLCENEK